MEYNEAEVLAFIRVQGASFDEVLAEFPGLPASVLRKWIHGWIASQAITLLHYNLSIAGRITHRQRRDGNPDHKRDRRCRPNCEVTGGTKQCVPEPAEQIAIDADLWWQSCERGIG